MLSFAANTDVSVVFPYTYNGTNLTLTDFKYLVKAADGSVLSPLQSDPNFNPANTSSTIVIQDMYNATSAKVDVRSVEVQMITAGGTFTTTTYYKLLGDQTKLTVMVDSFMVYGEAIVLRAGMAENLEYYDLLTDDLKCVALSSSFTRLTKIKYQVGTLVIDDLGSYTEAEFNQLPADFKLALKNAEIVEANDIVENSPIKDKIKSGIISETIGESSMFFSSKGASNSTIYKGISDEAYPYLEDYIYRDTTSAQIWRLRRA